MTPYTQLSLSCMDCSTTCSEGSYILGHDEDGEDPRPTKELELAAIVVEMMKNGMTIQEERRNAVKGAAMSRSRC